MRFISTIGVFAILLSTTSCFEFGDAVVDTESSPEADSAPVGPAIALVAGEAVRAKLEEAKGTVVVANFWATWCPPCVKETPDLIELYEKHHGSGVTFLSLSVDHPTTIESAVKPFVAEHGIPFDIYVIEEQNPDEITAATGLELTGAVPTTWVVDASGTPVQSWLGEVSLAQLEAAITPLIGGTPSD